MAGRGVGGGGYRESSAINKREICIGFEGIA